MKTKTDVKAGWWYQVQPGDNLSSIALREYGPNVQWPSIYYYKKNQQIIGPNPNYLRAGISIELW